MPALPSEIVNYTFAAGIDEKVDPWVIEAPRLAQLVNGAFTKNGQIRKRFGFGVQSRNISGGGTLGAAVRIGFRKAEQLLVDGHSLYAYSSGLSALSLSPNTKIDQVPELTATRSFIDNASVTAWDPDVGVINVAGSPAFEIYAWTNGNASANGDVFVNVIDASTGASVFRQFQLTSGGTYNDPHVCIVGTTAVIVYVDGTAGAIKCRRFSALSPTTWAVQQTLATDVQLTSGAVAFDAIGLTDRFVVGYESNIAAPRLRFRSFDSAGVAIASAVLTGENNTGFLSISMGYATSTSDPILVVYSYTGNTKLGWLNATTLATNLGPTTISNTWQTLSSASVKLDANTASIVLNVQASGSVPPFWSYKVAINNGITGVEHRMWNFAATARPFVVGGRAYAFGAAVGASATGSVVSTQIVDLQTDQNNTIPNHRPVATIAPRITSQSVPRTLFNSLSNVATMSASSFMTIGTILRSNSPAAAIGMTRVLINAAHTNRFQMLEMGENLHLTGGVPSYYDGRGVYEIGFLTFPNASAITATPSTTGGSMAAGTYLYVFTYEQTDAAGQRHRSAGSVQKLVTVGGTVNGSVAFTNIPNLMLTTRQDNDNAGTPPVEIVIYRSIVGGTTLYRLTSESTVAALQNSTSNQFTSFTDIYNDNGSAANVPLATMPLLYTTGGVLDNVCPPSSTLSVVHRGRLWLSGCDDPRQVWFSKQFVTGEAIAFCDSFTFTIEDKNPITALGSLDDVLVIFTRSSIYLMSGDGPTDSGVGNNFSTPERIASDVGCTEPRSVVLTPDGLMFQGEQGLMLLDRSHSVSYIGHAVEDSVQAKPVITSAVVKPDQNEVAFSVQDTSGSIGLILVYDYVQKAWAQNDVWDSVQAGPLAPIISAARSPSGVYTIATNLGLVMTERGVNDSSAYRDGTQWVTLKITTAWLKLMGLQGFQRIRRLGLLLNQQTPHGLTVAIAFDYRPSAAQTETITSTQLAVLSPPIQPMFRIGSHNGASPRAESIQVQLTDAAPSPQSPATGQGSFFVGLALEIARKPGLRRQAANQKW